MDRFRKHLTFANVVSLIALFVALGGTAMAAVIITDNSQVAQDTISGHHPPTGKHSNLIAGSVNGQDVDNNSVTGSDVKQGSLTGLDIQDRSGVDTCQTPLTAQVGPIWALALCLRGEAKRDPRSGARSGRQPSVCGVMGGDARVSSQTRRKEKQVSRSERVSRGRHRASRHGAPCPLRRECER
jgi:hypothetical protein